MIRKNESAKLKSPEKSGSATPRSVGNFYSMPRRPPILQHPQQNYPFRLNHLTIPAAALERSLLFKRLGTDSVGKPKKDPPGGGPKMRVNATGR
ncbi:hypothetical protein [Thiobacillus sp.]|uniref:hypothetical protein n=1 Tax=Thiobacillus sp. TaxID=924 RepID=UPI00286E4BFE|nr:hypothetical protein [Thiobacillus sp.]